MNRFHNPFPLWVWLLPLVGLLCSAPLWLHVWEPTMFVTLNTEVFAPVAPAVWASLSLLGNGWGVLGVTAPLLVLSPRLMWAWVCAAPFAALFARVGKEWIVSPRPAAVVDSEHLRLVGEAMYTVSMPSGHTTTAMGVACAIWLALDKRGKQRHAWLLLLGVGTGLSRIAVGAHWPGDVAVGLCLGLLAGLLGNVLLGALPPSVFRHHSWGLRVLALPVALAVYVLLTEFVDFAENLALQRVVALVAAVSLVLFAIRSARSLSAR